MTSSSRRFSGVIRVMQPKHAQPQFGLTINHGRLGRWRIGWLISWPIRKYLALSPFPKGKRVLWRILTALLPPLPRTFAVRLKSECTLEIGYREEIGIVLLTDGAFEPSELDFLRSSARPGTVAMDVGANVGITTIPMACALWPDGRVIACEPSSENAERLSANVHRNGLTNVEVLEVAASNCDGHTRLQLASDPAYHSITRVAQEKATGRYIDVPVSRLDTIWERGGRPRVSLIKIDVEGAELEVLKGSVRLIEACKPDLLVETNSLDSKDLVSQWLQERGYSLVTPRGFMPWNNVYSARCQVT
jgi:FkbM family methyltransferase